MVDLGGIARETAKLERRIQRLKLQLGGGSSRGDADIQDEIDEIGQQLSDIGWDEANKGGPVKKYSSGGLAKRGYGKARR
jgi:hypothetical protein